MNRSCIIYFALLLASISFNLKAQTAAQVFMEVLPGQTFSLINDSLFPSNVQLTAVVSISNIDPSASSVELTIKDPSSTILFNGEKDLSSDPNIIRENSQLRYHAGSFQGLNSYSGSIIIKDQSHSILSTITFTTE
jgi:hypothetical protein